jgi:hypothetical protein
MDFLRLEAGSEWYRARIVRTLWAGGKLSQAREAVAQIPATDLYKPFYKACSDLPSPTQSPSAEVGRIAREMEPAILSRSDPEVRYVYARDMAFCGQKDEALRLLKSAINGRYCAYQALQKDNLLVSLRGTPEYSQLLAAAKKCQDDFLAQRARLSH